MGQTAGPQRYLLIKCLVSGLAYVGKMPNFEAY